MVTNILKYTNQGEAIAVGVLTVACMLIATPWYTGFLVVPLWGLIAVFAILANQFLLPTEVRLPIGHCIFAPASTLVSIITFAPLATLASEKLREVSENRPPLSQLELNIITEARSRLQSVVAFYAKASEGKAKVDDHAEFCEHHASLYALLALAHQRSSGLTPEATALLAAIEADAATAYRTHKPLKDEATQ